MATQDPPRSRAGVRADRATEKAKRDLAEKQRKSDLITADELKHQWQGLVQQRKKFSMLSRDYETLGREIRQLKRREQELRHKKYD